MTSDYFIGLDLGQTTDFTAVAVLERSGKIEEPEYAVRHLQRFVLGTAYTTIVPAVIAMANAGPLKDNCSLVVDQTGVGRAVVDLLRRQPAVPHVVPVTITAGHAITVAEDGSRHVPKKELVTCLQLLLQSRRLQIARTLPDAGVLVRELEYFRVKITAAANETFGAWREGQHDDLVLAVVLACWLAERGPSWGPMSVDPGEGGIVERAPPGVFLT